MKESPENFDLIVVGGGISGISAALRARHRGLKVLLLERQPVLGGYTRSVYLDDFVFDYTGHLLHLSKYDNPSDIPHFNLRDHEWSNIKRNAKCLIDGRLIDAPFQYNLYQLPGEHADACRRQFIEAERLRAGGAPRNFREYLIGNFGEAIAGTFLIPYNRKLFDRNLDEISTAAVKRFFPPPDPDLVLRDTKSELQPAYNSRMWYPRAKGIQRLIDGADLKDVEIVCNAEIVGIDPNQRKVVLSSKRRVGYRNMIYTAPLNRIGSLIASEDLDASCRCLAHTNVLVFDIGVRGRIPEILEGVHWIYVPDETILYYRIGIYSNFSDAMASPDSYNLYVEIGVHDTRSLSWSDVCRKWEKILEDLVSRWGIVAQDVRTNMIRVLNPGYVNFTEQSDRVVPILIRSLRDRGIHPVGRYGTWNYLSMEDCIIMAMETVEEISS